MTSLKARLVPMAAGGILNPLMATVRYERDHLEDFDALARSRTPTLYALWHGRLLPLMHGNRNRGIGALISASADGDYIAEVARQWGFVPMRGSSSRGGTEGLREILRMLRKGGAIAITPDGPRGPMHKVKPGILVAAQLSGAAILPAAAGCDRAWWPGKWDRFLVPKPFATVRITYGRPMYIPREATEADLAAAALELEAELNRITAYVDAG